MKKLLLFALAAVSIPLSAQTAVFSVDGKTICSTNGVITLCNPASGLPPGMTFDGTTLSVPQIALTGPGAGTVPNTMYLEQTDANNIEHPFPYIPPSGNSSCTALAPVAIPASATTIPAGAATTAVTVTSTAITATSHITVTPTFTSTAVFPVNFEPFVRIVRANTLTVYARFMPYGSPQAFTGGTVNVEVCP